MRFHLQNSSHSRLKVAEVTHLKLVNILRWEATFHIISVLPTKQYSGAGDHFPVQKLILQRAFKRIRAECVRWRDSFIPVISKMLERMLLLLFFSHPYRLIGAFSFKALTNCTRWEWLGEGRGGTCGHRIPWKCIEFLISTSICHDWGEPRASRLLTFFASCQ